MKSSVAPPDKSTPVTVTNATRVQFRPLSVRQDHDAWVIGRIDTGDFISVPPVAHRAIVLLSEGITIGETAQVLRTETGASVALADFVVSLDELGFVGAIDDLARNEPVTQPRPSFPWLQPKHVRWLLHPMVPWVMLSVVTAAVIMTSVNPALIPRYHDLVWNEHSGIVLAVNVALGWVIMGLHELGHVATARALGVPSRVSIGTRLQFLALQTDVSGVWAAKRRHRLTVYLSGIAVNLIVASICVVVRGIVFTRGSAGESLALIAIVSLLFLPMEFLVFMRTDVYFVIQDYAGCVNLYGDGVAHLHYLAHQVRRALLRSGEMPQDPTETLRPRERNAIHAYSWLLLVGSAITLAVAVFISVPAVVTLLAHAFSELSSSSPSDKADGLAALAAICIYYFLWLRAWLHRHSKRLSFLKIPLVLRFSRR